MNKSEFKEWYPEIEERVFNLRSDGFPISLKKNSLSISLPESKNKLDLTRTHLKQLEEWKRISKLKEFVYYDHCGFSYKSYAEFFITVKHPEYVFFDTASEWPADEPLKFKIENVLITAGIPSALIILLTEPYYLDREIHIDGFSSLATIRIMSHHKINSQEYFHKALFYLNSYYLKVIGMYASLMHVNNNFDDPLGLYYGTKEPEKEFEKITRKRIRTRGNLQSCEPLILYNHAQSLENEERFLSLYRILEFFFTRNKLQVIEKSRYNSNITNKELLKSVELRNESQHLSSLLHEITTPAFKRKLAKYAKKHSLIKKETFGALCQDLYAFRNSIVHAKENEVLQAKVPDPFQAKSVVDRWIYIVRELSEKAIKELNTRYGITTNG